MAPLLAWLALAWLWVAMLAAAHAVVLPSEGDDSSAVVAPRGPLGLETATFVEDRAGPPLELAAARALLAQGRFEPSRVKVLNHGLGAAPVWLHLPVDNPGVQAQAYRLVAGASWIDRFDVYAVHDGHLLNRWHTGDALPGARWLTPAVGFGFDVTFPPGRSDVFLRLQSLDPAVLPVELVPMAEAASHAQRTHFAQGLLNGFMLALITSYGLLYLVLRERSHLDYVLYAAGFVLLNLCHTGFGQAWLWPGHPGVQRYAILVSMVLFCSLGLSFARRFLALAHHAPRVDRVVRAGIAGGPVALAACVVAGSQLGALYVAFGFAWVFSIGMVLLGVLAVRQRNRAGGSFLIAVSASGAGAFITTAAVLGWLPFNDFTYHAVALGVVLEAALWALLLALRLRQQQRDGVQARALAHRDPLTGLNNRRGFTEQAQAWWSPAGAPRRPVSMVMLDIDHFKALNDRHGHAAGDRALVALSVLLASSCRAGDIVARWGGEEFVLMLPDTGLPHAHALAERMRQRIASQPLDTVAGSVPLTASFGVAECGPCMGLEALLHSADERLYAAKRGGRNRVEAAAPPGGFGPPGEEAVSSAR